MFTEMYDEFIAEHRRRNIALGFVFEDNPKTASANKRIKIENKLTCHHVMPKCIGGMNSSSNYVYLKQDDHDFAHMLLGLSFIEMHKPLNEINNVGMTGLFNPTCVKKLFDEFPDIKTAIRFTICTFDGVQLSMTPNEAATMMCFKVGISPLNPANTNKSLAKLFAAVYGSSSGNGLGTTFGHKVAIEWKKNKKFIRMNKR